MMPSLSRQVNWGNCMIRLVNCAVLCVKDNWKGQFWGLRYCLSKLRSLLSFFRHVWRHTVKLLSLTENEYDALQLFYVRNPTVTGYWFSLLHDVNESKPSLYFICKLHLIKVEGWCSERMHLTERSDVLLSRKERNGLQR